VVTLCDAVKNDNQTGIVVRKLLTAGARSWWQWNWKWWCDPEAACCAMVAFFALVAKKYEKNPSPQGAVVVGRPQSWHHCVWQHCKVVTLCDPVKDGFQQALLSRICWQLEPEAGGNGIGSGSGIKVAVWSGSCCAMALSTLQTFSNGEK